MAEKFNVSTRFLDWNATAARSGKTAIEYGDERVTYGELLANTCRVGHALRRLGLRPEERVLLLLVDSPEFLYCFFGAIRIGAVPVPTNTLLKPVEYEFLLNDSRARILIVSEALLPQVQSIAHERVPHLRDMVVVGRGPKRVPSLSDLMAREPAELDPAATCVDDVAFWLYSSGSTGHPKACVHLQHDMVVSSERYANGILCMTADDRCYSVARLFFAYGLGNIGYFPLYFGATTILTSSRPTPESIYADIERYRPTLFFSVPTNYSALLAHVREKGQEFDLSSVRHAISAGESLPAALFHRFKERFGVEILDAWGSTETLQMVLSNRPGDVRPGSSGKVIPGFHARIVDESGRPVPEGEIGNLLVQADSTCAGYWNQHEKTKAAFEGAWYRTGDKYFQDDHGYFWYAGRSDDLFKVNGKWLSPAEVESALISHPAVQEAAVIARDDENGLTKPAAFVVLKSDHSGDGHMEQELQEWVGRLIAAYKRPRWIEFVTELPKTATGKLQRFKLRARAGERQRAANQTGMGSHT